MSDNMIQLNGDLIKHDLKDLVRSSDEKRSHDAEGYPMSRKAKKLLGKRLFGLRKSCRK